MGNTVPLPAPWSRDSSRTGPAREVVLYRSVDAEVLTEASRAKHEKQNLLNLPRLVFCL